MRTAPGSLRFTGTVRLTWRDRGATDDMVVHVTDDMGVLQVDSDAARVFDRDDHTYFKSDLGWSSALIEPDLGTAPAPDHRWRLVVARGRTIADRPTQLVEAVRADGTPAQRLFLDASTGMVLRREVLDSRGRVQRSLEFVSLDMGPVSAPQAPRGVATHDATPLHSVPSGYEAPSALSGYVLIARSRHPNGVELTYSDGMFSASVLEQRGDLDWGALPAHGTTSDIAGTRTRSYSNASADVVMFEHDGTVFTLATDAPPDSVASLVDRLTPSRSTAEQIVDYVLGPFGWD
jgi:sigma-E factor negative regulatory protein RseB